MYKLCFFVPESHAEIVKDALFAIGAGKYKNYDRCSWQTYGKGQFRPLEGSNPFTGTENKTEHVEELKVELICSDDLIKKAVDALLKAHPYEEVAYECFRIYTSDDL